MTDHPKSDSALAVRSEYILDKEVCHTVADKTGNVALCGADISAEPWCACPGGVCTARQECMVCAHLDDLEDDDG